MSNNRPGDVETFKAQVTFTCPFCKGEVHAGSDAEGRGGVLHTLPMCEKFEAMEPDVFMEAARFKMTGN